MAAGSTGLFIGDYLNWRRIGAYERLARALGPLARQLMGCRSARFYHEHMLVKQGDAGRPTPMHHDQPYYPMDGMDLVSLWLPLDRVGQEAAVRFVAGSHTWGRWFVPRKFEHSRNYQPRDGVAVPRPPDGQPTEEQQRELMSRPLWFEDLPGWLRAFDQENAWPRPLPASRPPMPGGVQGQGQEKRGVGRGGDVGGGDGGGGGGDPGAFWAPIGPAFRREEVGQGAEEGADEVHRLLSFDVEPGDAIAFHGRCLHGAPGNKTSAQRRVLVLRYLGDDVRIGERPWPVSPPTTGGLPPGSGLDGVEEFPQVG